MKRLIAAMMLAALTIGSAGCSPPRVAPNNLRLIASLRTALSAKNTEWLEQNVAAIEQRRAVGEMSDEEYAEFQAIIAKAKVGDWEAAERDSVEFQKAQRPTPEQIEQVTRGPRD